MTPALDSPVQSGFWCCDWARAITILVVSSALGLIVNHFSAHPLAIMAADGPGALPPQGPRISIAELKAALQSGKLLMLLDVRTAKSFQQEHPTDAINAPAEPVEEFIKIYGEKVAPYIPVFDGIVVMCDSEDCALADKAAKTLAGLKVQNVKVLEGGWRAYSASDMPKSGGGQ